MSEPTEATPPPAPPKRGRRRTAGALAASLDAAPPTQPTATRPSVAPDEPATEEPAETAADAPKESAATADPETADSASQGEDAGSERPQEDSSARDETSSGDRAPLEETGDREEYRAEIIRPPAPPSIPMGKLFRQKPQMDATEHAIYTQSLTKLLKSVRNVADMLAQRQTEFEEIVRRARNAGFPEADLERLAVQFEWEVPDRES